MNADLLAMLGQVPGVGAPSRRENEPKTLLSFKAGKMIAVLQPNGKYLVSSDPRRGTLEVNWTASSSSSSSTGGTSSSSSSAGVLKLEWKDRRTRQVVDSLTIFPEDDCTYSKVDTAREGDRVYLLQYGNASDRRFFFWMQEKEDGNEDEENCVRINTFMAEPDRAAAVANGEDMDVAMMGGEDGAGSVGGVGGAKKGSAGGATGADASVNASVNGALDSNALMSIMQGLNASGEATSTSTSTATANHENESSTTTTAPPPPAAASASEGNHGNAVVQVDALSNILENLGMPQNASSSAPPSDTNTQSSDHHATTPSTSTPAPTATTTTTTTSSSSSSTGGLTLSDLQGAMAGLATTSPQPHPSHPFAAPLTVGPPLTEVLSPENILESGILSNPSIQQKLLSLLPEHQQTKEKLMENLSSPQVQQCIKSLQAALLEDEAGVNSILANLQLRPEDGAIAMAQGNPIQAFLDCVLKSAQRENDEEEKEKEKAAKSEEHGDGDEEEKDGSGDAEMKE